MYQMIRLFFTLVACSALLSACGGGGGSSSSSDPVASTEVFQLRTAYANYVNDSRSLPYTLSGTISGYSVTGTGTLTQGAVFSTTFENRTALGKTVTLTGTLYANNRSIPIASTGSGYVDSNYNTLGFAGSEYEVVTSSTPIPLTARVNDTGVWYVTTRYSSASKTTRLGTKTTSFVLEPDTASTALLKIIEVERDAGNSITSTSTSSFRITPSGALTWLNETYLEGADTLIYTY